MAQAAPPPSESRRDQTSWVVTVTMVLLSFLGVAAVFGDTLLEAFLPPADPGGNQQTGTGRVDRR
jgi:hypothetical protein